uniref:FAD-dependent oxidoreductase n=1 Tax=Macrostomum lignano TaxID=282301 RepID=A0A1I8JA14_9PLAT
MSVINSVNKKSIAIVGSGLSGLTAACLLHKLGFSVTVFEAAPDRIGGRIFSVWEVWQQRQDNLPDLCDQSSTYQYDWTQCACVTDSGQPVDCSDIRQAEQTIRQHLADVYNLPPSVLKDAYSDRMGAYVESKLPMDADSTIYGSALKTFALFYANVEGVHSLNDLSIVGGSDYTCPDGQCLVAGGMVGLIDALADRLPDNCVRLNS